MVSGLEIRIMDAPSWLELAGKQESENSEKSSLTCPWECGGHRNCALIGCFSTQRWFTVSIYIPWGLEMRGCRGQWWVSTFKTFLSPSTSIWTFSTEATPPGTCSVYLVSEAKQGWVCWYLGERNIYPFPQRRDGLVFIPAHFHWILIAFSVESLLVSVLGILSTHSLTANIKHTQNLRHYGKLSDELFIPLLGSCFLASSPTFSKL